MKKCVNLSIGQTTIKKEPVFGYPIWRSDILGEFKREMKTVFFKFVFEKCNTYEGI